MLNEDIKDLEMNKGCIYFGWGLLVLIVVLVIVSIMKVCRDTPTIIDTPKEFEQIDSIRNTIEKKQQSIIKLDSEKNETIAKIKTFNNDSTLDLFRELVWE